MSTLNKNFMATSKSTIARLKVLAKEKESVRKKLRVTAEALRIKAHELFLIAKEKI